MIYRKDLTLFWRLQLSIIFITLFLVLYSLPNANAEVKKISLVCKYIRSYNDMGQSTEMSGEDLFTIKYSDRGQAKITRTDFYFEYIGTITDEEIRGQGKRELTEGVSMERAIYINRYTGAFTDIMGYPGQNRKGHVSEGVCIPAEKKF